jgi:hypothetical protein
MKKWTGFDDCVIGTSVIWRDQITVEVLVYCGEQMIDILIGRDGMLEEEAHEFLEFNVLGAYIGIDTPVIVFEDPEWDERDYDEN